MSNRNWTTAPFSAKLIYIVAMRCTRSWWNTKDRPTEEIDSLRLSLMTQFTVNVFVLRLNLLSQIGLRAITALRS